MTTARRLESCIASAVAKYHSKVSEAPHQQVGETNGDCALCKECRHRMSIRVCEIDNTIDREIWIPF